MRAVFLDTSGLIALASESDAQHDRALSIARALREKSARYVTTEWVLFELANCLRHPSTRQVAHRVAGELLRDTEVEIILSSRPLLDRALDLYGKRLDKTWSLTDCASFVAMKDRDLTDAFTHDRDFEQAGFRALLRSF